MKTDSRVLIPLLVLAACAVPSSVAAEPTELKLGQSIDERPITARVWGSEEAEETILIIASIHGSEPAGTPLVEQLEIWLAKHPEAVASRRIAIIPVANPDGYAAGKRFNSRQVDLNRNFPAGNRTEKKTHGETALSEPESRALMRALQVFNPQRVVSLHQPIACIDYDGPGEKLAEAMGEAIENRLPVRKLGGRPGSLGSYVGVTLGRPIITLELPKDAEQREPEALWNDYGPALRCFVEWQAPPSRPVD